MIDQQGPLDQLPKKNQTSVSGIERTETLA